MANLSKRASALEHRFSINEGNAELARQLVLARLSLKFSRKAHEALGELLTKPFKEGQCSRPEFHKAAIASAHDQGKMTIRGFEDEVARLERLCADAGMTEVDILELGNEAK